MKKKITITLDENILFKIDKEVSQKKAKNRSAEIESHLIKYYGDFTDASAIIFAYDRKWDNREYPFAEEKAFLEVRGETLLARQIQSFLKSRITDIHIIIPINTTEIFYSYLEKRFPQNKFFLYEVPVSYETGDALQIVLKENRVGEKLFISNGDIFYGSLNIEAYYQFHKKHEADFSFCLKFVMNPEQLGNVVIQGAKVLGFVEKPKAQATYLTNSGMYISSKKFLSKNNFGSYLERDFFPFICENANVVGFLYSGEWEHIQNDSAFERVNGELL